LRAVLDAAVRDGLVARNAAAAEDRLYALVVLLLGTGLRRGETLALCWTDVDLDDGAARVRDTLSPVAGELTFTEPKTERSRRTVVLPRHVVAELRAHRARQAAERLSAGSAWSDQNLVFATRVGTPTDPRNAARAFEGIARRAELPAGTGLHTLRHSVATALLMAGTHMKVVQSRSGTAPTPSPPTSTPTSRRSSNARPRTASPKRSDG